MTAVTSLIKIEQARQALSEAKRMDDVKEVRDRAEAIRQYAKQARLNVEIINDAAEIKIRAERRIGELLAEMDKHEGGRPPENPSHDVTGFPPKLSDLGIERMQSHRAQLIATIPEPVFERHIADVRARRDELTTVGMLRVAKHTIQEEARKMRPSAIETVVPLPNRRYQCIVLDPPWPMEKIEREERPYQGKALEYPTMTIDEIAHIPLSEIAAEMGCHVYLWVTHKYLPVGFQFFEQWGVKYQCLLTWVKPTGMTPFSWMYNTEHVLFGRIGTLDLLKLGVKLSFDAPVVRHSQKPDVFYEIVRQVSPSPRLDMFARRRIVGFDVWGNEVKDDGEKLGR